MGIQARGRAARVEMPAFEDKTEVLAVNETQSEIGYDQVKDPDKDRVFGIGEPIVGGIEGMEGETIERKESPEDFKINLPEQGLYGVLDGVSAGGGGDRASKMAAEGLVKYLAGELDTKLENQRKSGEVHPKAMEKHIEMEIRATIGDIEEKIRLVNSASPNKGMTTLSFGKRFTHPDGRERMAIVSIGDSRVYRMRENQFDQLTQDDSLLNDLVSYGRISKKRATELQRMDYRQAKKELSKEEFELIKKREMVTNVVGMEKMGEYNVQFVDVLPGDRYLFTTDGIHDNLTDQELQALLQKNATAEAAERGIQRRADFRAQGLAEDGRTPLPETVRSKWDDQAAVVVNADRPAPKLEEVPTGTVQERGDLAGLLSREKVQGWKQERHATAKQIDIMKRQIDRLPVEPIMSQRTKELKLEYLKLQEAYFDLEAIINDAELNRAQIEIPPRIQQGEQVRVYRDNAPRQAVRYEVEAFDADNQEYWTRAGGVMERIPRFKLEFMNWKFDKEVPVQLGDIIPIEHEGKIIEGMEVTSVAGDEVVLNKPGVAIVKTRREVQDQIFNRILESSTRPERIDRAEKKLEQLEEEKERLEDERIMMSAVESPEESPGTPVARGKQVVKLPANQSTKGVNAKMLAAARARAKEKAKNRQK